MGYVIKHSLSGQYLLGIDNENYGQFSDNFNTAWWWETEDDANWFISQNSLQNVVVADDGGSNPPGPGQPGKP